MGRISKESKNTSSEDSQTATTPLCPDNLHLGNKEATLYTRLQRTLPKKHIDIVNKAITFAQKKYYGKKRLSGDSLLSHCLQVAILAREVGLDVNSAVAGILHHIIRETPKQKQQVVEKQIQENFDKDIYELIRKTEEFSRLTRYTSEGEAVTKMILGVHQDLRTVLIRLSDKMVDLHTIEALSPKDRQISARKSLDIYAPLSSFLNLKKFSQEFRRVAFKIAQPKEFKKIDNFLRKKGLATENNLSRIKKVLTKLTQDIEPAPMIFGRMKSHYSIFKKLRKYSEEGKTGGLSDLEDLLAFSVIVSDVEQCYKVAGIIQMNSVCNLDTFEDYIADPKPNGFSELQLIIQLPGISPTKVEIQIMTMEMYDVNTYGPASHFAYKSAGTRFAQPSKEYTWVKNLREKIKRSVDPKEDSRSRPIYSDIFEKRIFVFTPTGEIIELPLNSTVVDFAFKIHSELGAHMTGAKVNGKMTKINTALENGDTVEIMTNNKSITANTEWLGYCQSTSTKQKIKKYIQRKATREQVKRKPRI